MSGSWLVGFIPVIAKPLDGAFQAFFEVHFGAPAEELIGTRCIQAAPRLSVGLGAIPDQPALEAGQADDGLGQIFD